MSARKKIIAHSSDPEAKVKKAMRVAKVLITVNAFKDVMNEKGAGAKRGVDYQMKMQGTQVHPQVYVKDDVKPAELHIKPGGATIQFVIVPKSPNKEKEIYYPLGISFLLTAGTTSRGTKPVDRLGRLNYAQSKILAQKNSIFVTDSFKDGHKDDAYEFSIMIQQKSTGAIGIIDPPIIHDPA